MLMVAMYLRLAHEWRQGAPLEAVLPWAMCVLCGTTPGVLSLLAWFTRPRAQWLAVVSAVIWPRHVSRCGRAQVPCSTRACVPSSPRLPGSEPCPVHVLDTVGRAC
jgi:hypothetical protein